MIYLFRNPISGLTEYWRVTYTLSAYHNYRVPPGGEIENLRVYGETGTEITNELPPDIIEDIECACYDD